MRAQLPPGYEIADAPGIGSPAPLWGLRPGWTAEPQHCAAMLHPTLPTNDGAAAQGLSGSGSGGLVYIVAVPDPVGAPDPALLAECAHWTTVSGQTSATVTVEPAPVIDGVPTVAMSATIRTVVESGTETDTTASTFLAYPAGHSVFVTLITDPGSPDTALPVQFAAELLVKSVDAVRG